MRILQTLVTVSLLAVGTVSAADPELIRLKELPANASHSGPWLSPDGLTLYWQSNNASNPQRWVWCAERRNAEGLFENARKLVPGNDPTVTGDGLEMIILEGGKLQTTTRASVTETFSRPRAISEFESLGFLAAPCLSEDGLTLHAEHLFDMKIELVIFTRSSRNDKWSQPTTVKVQRPGPAAMRFFHVPAGSQWAFGSIPDRLKNKSSNNLIVFSVAEGGRSLNSPTFIEIPRQVVQGTFPRYVKATKELFFSGEGNKKGEAQIMVIRNFEPRTSE